MKKTLKQPWKTQRLMLAYVKLRLFFEGKINIVKIEVLPKFIYKLIQLK